MTYNESTASFEKMLLRFVAEPDPMLSMLEWLCHKLMEVEVENKVGAVKGKHSEGRSVYLSGTRVRRFDTRLGTMYLMVPKIRKGGYVPFFVTEKKRSEQALLQVVQEAYINGVSTRKIERLAKSLGIESISAGQVSEINKELDEKVNEFRQRKLESVYPVIWIDALYEKIRVNGRVANLAAHVLCGINMDGKREILAVEPMYEESRESYKTIFENLKARGLREVWLAVSDAHKGLVAAVTESFIGCSWQRCKVHLMRNILAHVPAKNKEVFGARLKQIWNQPKPEIARMYANQLIDEYSPQFPKAIEVLEDGLEDSLQFFAFERIDSRKISSTNVLERLNKEIRRRSRVVGVFPSMDSYVHLVGCYLLEFSEDWEEERCYIQRSKLEDLSSKRKVA